MVFYHLHIHSYFSMMWGTAPIEPLAKCLLEQGQDVFPLTDRNGLYGMVEHLQVCRELGMRPVVGCELVVGDEQALCLVKTQTGYHNLCEMLTRHYHDPRWRLSQDIDDLQEGLVIITQTPAILDAGFPDADLYIDLCPGKVEAAVKLHRERGIPMAATCHAYMISEKARPLHVLLRAIDTNSKLSRLPQRDVVAAESHLYSREAMAARFAAYPDALEATRDIVEACQFAPELGRLIFPPSEYDHTYKVLRDKTFAGMARRYGRINEAARRRADRELDMIRRKRFSNCFLVIEDVVSRFSLTCGRGSAAASIVSYALGITHVDPLEHNLFFERFLNPGRRDPPDIDIDFAWDERDGVRDYLWEKYGGRHIAMVCNHNRFRTRSAVRELAKVYGLGEKEMEDASRQMSSDRRAGKKTEMPEPWPDIFKIARRLEDYPRHISVHCGGVVITPDEITRHCPLRPMPIGYDVAPWDKDGVEDYGFVKLDFLGNRSLAVIRDCLAAVKENYGVPISYEKLNPIKDPQAQKLIAAGDTMGCFYVESPATRLLLNKVGMGDYETLTAVSSIIRPAANRIANDWVMRHRRVAKDGGKPNWKIIHPKLDEVLEETHGLMIYQEDVTRVAMALAGFNAIDGDMLRKIMSKKHKEKLLRDYRRKFYAGCRETGLDTEQTNEIWEMIKSFEHYSFCKPHSASYAMVSFKSAFLKYHYPAEFMAAVISNRGGFYSPFAYLSHARRLGLKVLGPDINRSRMAYRGYNGVIHIGFGQIKGLRRETVEALLKEREQAPFQGFNDFLHRVPSTPEETKRLILAGCFDHLEQANRPTLIWRALHWQALHQGQSEDLFPGYVKQEDLPEMEPYSLKTLLLLEKQLFGFWISRHPLERYDLSGVQRIRATQIGFNVHRVVTLAGWLVTHKTVTTRTKEYMCFLTFEDETGLYETVMFPDVYKQRAMLIDYTKPFLVRGLVSSDMGAITITIEDLCRLEAQPRPGKLLKQKAAVGN